MGIRNLNSYLKTHCPNSIQCVNMSDLDGKKIVVDVSIYLYRYETENALLENMYVMLSIFRHYNIIPIFIFDGKPPDEKKELLKKRKEDREIAQEEYNKLTQQLENITNADEKHDIVNALDLLKKQIVQINKNKIENVKALIRAFGNTYFDAPGEADELCALLVSKKKVWACLSEDMDLFVYGCTRVLRYFSLINHTVVVYSMKQILKELKMTQTEFRNVCILSGTDYNIHLNPEINLKNTLYHFYRFKKSTKSGFYDWLVENTNYIEDFALLTKIDSMFNLENVYTKLDIFNNVDIINGPIRQDDIENIMKDEGFIFCKKSH
jgi:flap endonuclease-1